MNHSAAIQLKPVATTVLVVDDEVLIRCLIAEHLREEGFNVIEARNAAEAIDVLNSGVDISLVFSDINMPGDRDGFALAEWITARKPGVEILLTSGVFRNLPLSLVGRGITLVPKPYLLSEVSAQINSRLICSRAHSS
ncbi:response regulator [Ferrovibrio sp.]|uniref:response regulator n=1 Tax=Ferrovibrio sp. TaxID=1917215 RepID=UPI0035AF84EB